MHAVASDYVSLAITSTISVAAAAVATVVAAVEVTKIGCCVVWTLRIPSCSSTLMR